MRVMDRKYYLKRRKRLQDEQSTIVEHWRELSEHIQPRRSRFLLTEQNQNRRSSKIINGAPLRASNILASGLMAGATSPSRPWFQLATPDPDLNLFGPVRGWMHDVATILFTTFAKSNFYNGLHNVYTDLSWSGTSALLMEDDRQDIIRTYSYPVGQYFLATSARQQIDTFYLDLLFTVDQLVEKFGLAACSQRVKNHYERQDYDTPIEVLLAVEPNRNRNPRKLGHQGMAWKAVWLEKNGKDTEGVLLESGYRDFPVLAPRWDVTGGDTYGHGPGMNALGDCKALQKLEREKAQAFTIATRPTLVVPSTFLGREDSFRPGDVIYNDLTSGSKIEAAYTPHPQILSEFRQDIPAYMERISQAFFADLWLAITNAENRDMTAREIAERHEEKLLQLGPALERLQDELLDPAIDRAFSIHLERGFIPPPPPELEGQELKVEHISILAQAQKLLGTSSMERMLRFTNEASNVNPEVVDKLDYDKLIENYGDALGISPHLMRGEDQVAQIRQQRAQAAQAQAQAEQFSQTAQGIRAMSGDIGDNSAIAQLQRAYGGAQ